MQLLYEPASTPGRLRSAAERAESTDDPSTLSALNSVPLLKSPSQNLARIDGAHPLHYYGHTVGATI